MTWSGAVFLGLYMLTVWLIKNDATGRDHRRIYMEKALPG